MKKIFTIFALLLGLFSVNNYTNAIEVVTSNVKTTSCAGANVNKTYYIGGGNVSRFIGDMFSTSDDRLISNNKSKVTIWSSDSSLLSGCNSSSDWSRISTLSPGSNTSVLALGANCTFNKPTNKTNRTLQFVYNIGYYDIFSGNGQYVGDYNLGYFLNLNELSAGTAHTVDYNNVGFDNLNIHSNECLNIELRYCGDGIISDGETCDDGNNTSGDGCSSTCNDEGVVPPTTSSSSSSGGGSSSSSSSSSSSGGGHGSTYCGDGRVQRPNSDLEMEECDFGSESDWGFCNRDCTYSDFTIPGTCDPSINTCDITLPGGGSMSFGINDSVIIGAGMNPYVAHNLGKPFISNSSDYDLYFDSICVVKKDGLSLLGTDVCEPLGIIRANTTKTFPYIPDFVGDKVTTGNYSDNTLVTTIKHRGIRYDNAYFISKLDVRVAKSSVVTTGGGTSYLSSSNKVGNISDISNNGELDPSQNKNFVGVGVSNGDASSYSKEINDSDRVNTIAGEGDNFENNISNISDTSGSALGSTTLLSDFESYNGIENVFILKNTNFVINGDLFSGLDGARTYIIENGDLQINSDINYSDNIAFVVKGGDILIDKNVDSIDGTYITIEKDSNGGSFKGINGDTTNRLLVNGSLYGNIDNLISHRTYVKQNSFNQIDVGTIVSFGSSLFRKTAPLLSSFIDEYQESIKVAQ